MIAVKAFVNLLLCHHNLLVMKVMNALLLLQNFSSSKCLATVLCF